jgi:heat shock protein HtpX
VKSGHFIWLWVRHWLQTLGILLVMLVIFLMLGLLAIRFAPRLVTGAGLTLIVVSATAFFSSRLIIIRAMNLERADPDRNPSLYQAMDRVYAGTHLLIRPRLYLADMASLNAFAFGWGLFSLGDFGIAVSKRMAEEFSVDQLSGVLAHETAHIKSGDLPLMTLFSLLTNGARWAALLLFRSRLLIGWGVAVLLMGIWGGCWLGKNAFSQTRELMADLMAARYLRDPTPLIAALQSLESTVHFTENESIVADIAIHSHPHVQERIAALQSLRR